jgi:uncharacterized protein
MTRYCVLNDKVAQDSNLWYNNVNLLITGDVMKKIYSANLFFLFIIILQVVSVAALGPIIKSTHIPIYSSIPITEFLLIFLPSIIYLFITKQQVKEALSLRTIGFKSVLIVLIIGLLIYPAATFVGLASQLFFHNYLADAFQTFASLPPWQGLLMIAVTPAICEETAMRGAVLAGYKNTNMHKAAVMNGFLFGILHMNLQQFFYAFAIGVVFAYLVMITGSIFSSMLCHFTCNGISYMISYYAMKNIPQAKEMDSLSASVKSATLITFFVVFIICCTLIVLLIKALQAINKKKSEERYEKTIESMYQNAMVGNLMLKDNREKVMNWPIYAAIIVFIAFMAAFQMLSRVSMLNK